MKMPTKNVWERLKTVTYSISNDKSERKKLYATLRDISSTIFFYDKKKPYYEFTNFAEGFPIIKSIFGTEDEPKMWPTTEQYFQAMKFAVGNQDPTKNSLLINKIRTFRTEYNKNTGEQIKQSAAKKAFNEAKKYTYDNETWKKIGTNVMWEALVAKYTQYPLLRALLLATGAPSIVIVEDSQQDPFYGRGADFTGANVLGRMLMLLRNTFRQIQKEGTPLF